MYGILCMGKESKDNNNRQPDWQSKDGTIQLYLGDCLEILPTLKAKSIDCIITDPPYGVNYEGGHFHSNNPNIKRKRDRIINDDNADIYMKIFPLLKRVVDGPCYIFYASIKADIVLGAARSAGFGIHASIIWHKINAKYASLGANYKNRYEPILYCKPKSSKLRWAGPTNERTVWEMPRESSCLLHPTQKPVALIERAIRNHDVEIILDPFMGSGTTGIACINLNKKFIGIEKERKYFDIAVDRIEKHLIKYGR